MVPSNRFPAFFQRYKHEHHLVFSHSFLYNTDLIRILWGKKGQSQTVNDYVLLCASQNQCETIIKINITFI